jgi:hypothetical protein
MTKATYICRGAKKIVAAYFILFYFLIFFKALFGRFVTRGGSETRGGGGVPVFGRLVRRGVQKRGAVKKIGHKPPP